MNAHYHKRMDPPVIVRNLPEGSRKLVDGINRFSFWNTVKDIAEFTNSSYFKKFQLAETSEELTDLIDRNVFSICAYFVKMRNLNNKALLS